MKTKRIISIVTTCMLACTAAFSVHAVEQEKIPQDTLSVSYDAANHAEYAEQVAALVNQERAANGLQPLSFSPLLSEAAVIRSGELKENFSHTRPDGTSCFTAMDELGITYRAAAENIAYGQRSPESVMDAWMNSSGHRANILNESMEYIGVGVVYREGVYYWTQLFAVSEDLSDGAYLPGENGNPPEVTSTAPAATTQTTTAATSAASSTAETTLSTTTTTKTVTTEPPAATSPGATTEAVQTTAVPEATTTSAEKTTSTTAQTKPCAPITTKQTTTACIPVTTNDCAVIITKPVNSGDCSAIGGGVVILYPKR